MKISIAGTKFQLTEQRRIILDELYKSKSHPTADELYQKVRNRLPRISLGTVYRNLDILSEKGIIRTLRSEGGQKRFDGDLKPHYHLRCVHCDVLVDADVKPVVTIREPVRWVGDFEVIGHRFEFLGICPQCRQGLREKGRPDMVGREQAEGDHDA